MSTFPLCSWANETLANIINFGPITLNQGRYTWRHDSVLNHLYDQVKAEATGDIEIFSDLPGKGINNSTIPQDIIITNGFGSKPDLVVLSRSTKTIALLELTCPLDRNLHKAHSYKVDKYTDLESDLRAKSWKVHLVPFEVSSRGQILKHTKTHIFNTLKVFNIKFRTHQKLTKNLSKISLLCTFAVFHAFQTKEWIDPPFLKP